MYRSKRKAFTITELVIVIAVIAILAAVLIPTFSNVVESANKSAAMSNCRMAVAEYISMVTLDDDPDNNDVSGMVFSNDGYYFVYMDQKLAELGQAGKSNNILNIASDSTAVDAGALEGFDIQTSRSADAIQTVTFTVNGKSTTVDLNELKNTGRALYLYNFQSEDGSKYAGFFVINAADGGDDYVISGANYSLVAGYSKYSESGPIKIATDTPTIEQPLLTEVTAQYTGVPVKAGEEVTSVNVTVTATYSDGSSKEVENFTASDISSTAGKHNVTLGYTDGEVTLTCQTEVYVASGLTATLRNEEKPLVLKHNGTVDIDDVYAVYDIAYDLGDTTQPAQSAEVTDVVSDTVGQTGSVTLTCGAFQLTIDNLTVVKVFDSIKAVYEGGEIEINGKLDDGKVLVYAIFSDGTTELITEGYTLSSVDTSAAGEKTVTVTYGEDNPKTATFTVTVVKVTANTYYFYNANGWANVYAYTWSENYVEVTPTAGDYVLMGTILGEEGAWTVEKSVKLFFDAEGGKNEYVFKGLNLTAGMQFKVAYINADGNPVYFNLNSTPNNEGKDYIDANSAPYQLVGNNNIEITSDGVYDFYFDANNYKLYFAKTKNPANTPNVAILSTEYSGVFPGTAMTAVDGKPGWWSVQTDSRATFVKFSDKDNSANETGDLTLDSANVYYNNGWTSEIAQTTYYFYNVGGWAEVYAYVWTGEGNVKVEHLNAFPGTAMTEVEGNAGWYSITVDNNASNVIFSNGKTADGEKLQTGNLVLDPQTPWCTYGNWYGEQPQMNTYYFYNADADGWANVYAYAWTDGTYYFGNGSGVKMFDCGDGWYSVAVDANAVNINFNNGTISSDNDLQLNPETPYYFGVWKAHKPTGIEAVYEGETLTVEHKSNGTLTVAEGLSVTLKYDNGDSEQVEGFTVTADTSTVGPADMEVSYTLGKMTFTCTVQDKVNVVAVLESIRLNPSSVTVNYGQQLSSALTDFTVTAVYSDNSESTVQIENCQFGTFDSTQEGEQQVTVTFNGKTATLTVTVQKVLDSITAAYNGGPVKVNGTLDISDFTVTAHYVGSYSEEVTQGAEVTADTSKGGTVTATVSYGDKSTEVEGIVVEKSPRSIEVTTELTEVAHNSVVDKSEFTVTLTFDDETTEILTGDAYTVTGDFATVGSATLTFEYSVGETVLSDTVTVTVYKTLQSVSATHNGETIYVGDEIVAADFTVTATYSDNSTAEVTNDVVLSDNSTETAGQVTVEVTYTERNVTKSCTVILTVIEKPVEPVLQSIEATFTPQGVVFVNTEITASDFKVTKVMSNGDSETVSDTENVSVALKAGSTNAVEGTAIYVVTYQGKIAEVEVTFTRELTGITAVATETTVEYGGTLELTVTANYNGAASATVTDYTTDFDNTTTGLQTVTVTYTENDITQTTTVQVVVNGVGQKTYFFKNTKDWSDVYAYAWSEEAPAAGDYIIVGINGNWDTGLKMSKMEDVATGYRYVKWTINEAVTFKVRLYQGDVWSAGVGIAESGISYTVADGGNITLQPGTYTIDFYTDSKNINISWYDETDGAQTSVNIYTSDWPGTAMKEMPGYEGWYYITIDANAQKIIFNNNAGDQTSNLDLNSDYVYYNGTEWVTSILA